jgi:transcriptional regulator with XRE-family HTH domain
MYEAIGLIIDANGITVKAKRGLFGGIMIVPSQIRAARALLGLSQRELAVLAAIGLATIKRIEAAPDIRGTADTFWKIQKALETSGVEFIPEEAGRGPGVRLKQARDSEL